MWAGVVQVFANSNRLSMNMTMTMAYGCCSPRFPCLYEEEFSEDSGMAQNDKHKIQFLSKKKKGQEL